MAAEDLSNFTAALAANASPADSHAAKLAITAAIVRFNIRRAYTARKMSRQRLPVYFISHGGGPWSYMDDPSRAAYAKLEAALAAMPREIGERPAVVLMISAHWEETEFTLTSS